LTHIIPIKMDNSGLKHVQLQLHKQLTQISILKNLNRQVEVAIETVNNPKIKTYRNN